MLKQLYRHCAQKVARAEHDLYVRAQALGGAPLKAPVSAVFAHLASGIQYIAYGFLLFAVKFFVLVFKSPVEGYQLMVEPQTVPVSYAEYKRLHSATRRFSLWTSGAVVAAVVTVSLVLNLIIPAALPSLGATYTFSQTSWSGGATANNATHPTNQSSWNQYSSKSAEVITSSAGADLVIASSTYSVLKTSGADFTGGAFSNATTINSDTSIRLTNAAHVNEYTIGALSNIAVTASTVTTNANGTWTVTFSGTPSLARIFKNDKFTDSASKAWKVLSASDSADKIIVVDSEANDTAPAAGAGTVGRWYASISAWETGRQGDLVTRNAIERGLPYYDGSADTNQAVIDGWTTDATHYIELFVPLSERHRGVWNTAKYRLETSGQTALSIVEDYVRVEGLQVQLTTSSSNNRGIYMPGPYGASTDIRISNNIVKGVLSGAASAAYGIQTAATGTYKIWNNIVYDFVNGANTTYGIRNAGGTTYVYNNVVQNSYIGFQVGTGTFVAKNNIYQSNGISGADGFVGTFDAASNYNISDLASDAPGANSKNSTTVTFIDAVNKDFHLQFNDAAAKNAGADLSADANLAFSTDIDGDTRSGTWDIGADDVGAVLVKVHSIGTAGRDFSTLQAWEDVRDGNLTTRHVFKISSQSGAFVENEQITGSVSGATGYYVKERETPSASETHMTLGSVFGTFQQSETLTGGTSGSTATLSAILTTAGVVEKGEVYNDSVFTAGIVIAGSTVDATRYMWLTAEPGSRHDGTYTNKGARIEPSFANALGVIEGQNNYTRVEWLSVKVAQDNWHGLTLNASDLFGSNMVLYAPSVISGTNRGFYGSNNATLRNSVIYGAGWDVGVSGATGVLAYNVTVYDVGAVGFNSGTLVKNSIAVGSTTDFQTMDASSSNNISQDATAPGSGSLASQTVAAVKFVSTTSGFEDLHIMDGSIAEDAGTSLSATFTNDVDSQTRSGTWDIGADEWQSFSPVYNTSGTFESPSIDLGTGNIADFTTLSWAGTTSVSENGMVGLWHLDGATGSIAGGAVISDSQVNGTANNGTASNADGLGMAYTTGKVGQGINFDGSDDYISIPDAASLDLGSAGSVTAWAKRLGTGQWDGIVAKGDANNTWSHNYAINFRNDNTIECNIGNGSSSNVVTTTVTITDSNFHHYVCTWDGSTVRFYIDGAFSVSTPQTLTPTANTAPLYIGQFGGNVDRFIGVIDEVAVYNRALSDKEVAYLYGGLPVVANTDLQLAVAANNDNSTWNYVELNRETYPSGVTVHTSYVRPSGQCTGYSPCYNSLSAWEVAQQRNLVALNEIEVAQIGGSWTSADTAVVTIDGWTTDATHYIRIFTAPEARHGGKWDENKYRMRATGGAFVRSIYNIEDYTRIEGLQIDAASIDVGILSYNFAYVGYNIVKSGNHGVYGSVVSYNNIVYDSASRCFWISSGSSSARYYNNTAYNCGVAGFDVNSGAATVKNNIAYNSADNYAGSFNAASRNNLSGPSQTDAPGSNARNGATVTFADAANGDFRLAFSDAGALNYGADLSADADYAFNMDTQGHLRTGMWDIGAHEYGATGGNIPASLDGSRYVRYKAYFSTQDAAFSSRLDDITVNYFMYATTSPSLISSAYNSADATNILGKIAWTATTPSGTEIRMQMRSAPDSAGSPGTWSSWCGETACDDADYFAAADNNVDLAANHPLKNGGNDQWLQYKAILVSTGAATPTLSDVTLTYVVNAPADFEASYGTNGISVSQNTSDGQVVINYRLRDVDTSTGTVTPGYITPSFAYSTDGGNNWTNITSSYLGASDLANKAVQGASYTTHTATWNAKGQINGTYNATMKVRVTANDNEGANNTASAVSGNFALDVKNPAATVTVDGTKSGQANAVSITSSDDSSYQMMASNNSDFSADGLNATSGQWVAAASSLTWTFASSEPVRVYIKFKDSYQNETSLSPDAPSVPANVTIQDTSNLTLSEFREFVSWSVNAAGDFASYKVYRSTDGSSYSLINTIASASTNFMTDGSTGAWLSNGTTYYYKVTAQDASGNISRYSSVVSDIPDGQGGTDVTAPTITSVAVSGISTSQATVTWTTDELSNSNVTYSTNTSYNNSATSTSMVTSHSVTLTGLSPNTTYNIRVRSVDPLSNSAQVDAASPGSNPVGNFSFTTAQGAVISSVSAIAVSGNSATIVWNTNQDSDSYVVYSANADLSGSQTTGSATLVGGAGPTYEHRVTLTGLSTNQQYYYKVRSTNGSGNLAEDTNGGGYYTFTTVNDVTAPTVSNVASSLASQTSAVITWLTNELADSQVLYGTTAGNLNQQTSVNATMTINHSVVISSLTAGTTYYYKVVSADPQGNSTTSSEYSFGTTAQDIIAVTRYVETGSTILDRTPPTVTGVSVSDITDAGVKISWNTDEDASSFVGYGRTELLNTTLGRFENVRSHTVVLDGLLPNTTYFFKAKSHDASGNLGESVLSRFTTLARSSVVDAVAQKAQETKDVAALTEEVERLLADLEVKVEPPQISGVEPKISVTSSFAEIIWATDRPSNSIVAYAEEKDYLPSASEPYAATSGDPDERVTQHRVTLSNLTPGTLYHFQVRSKGVVGGVGKSADLTFRTRDEAGISEIEVREITKDSATVFWRTNVSSTTRLEYGLSTDYTAAQSDGSSNTSHLVIVKGLQPGTFYHYRVGGVDQQGRQFFSPDLTFTTQSLPSVLDVKIDSVKEQEMTVRWFTTVLSDSTLEYTNVKTGKTESVGEGALVKNHALTVKGLEQDTPYTFRVISRDEAGSEVASSPYNLQTLKDIDQPLITTIQNQSAVSGKDRVQTIVSWRTSEPASSRVYWQEGVVQRPELERSTPVDNELTVNHTMVFTGFKPGTAYRLRVESIDASGNVASSRYFTILTPQQRETVFDLLIKNFQDVFNWTERVF